MRRLSIVPLAGALLNIFFVHVPAGLASTYSVLHSFNNLTATDGALPVGGLIDVPALSGQGILYGTTVAGGTGSNSGNGTVFSFDLDTSTERVLHDFAGGTADGASPLTGLISVSGILYSTTAGGGGYNSGTVFSMNPTTGAETVVHSFGNGTDGSAPDGDLIDVNGALYGTTQDGGTGSCSTYGCGTVFSVNLATGVESVVYSFQGGTDGELPVSSLIDVNGTLYGITDFGGASGHGTVFSVSLATGTETVVYSFCPQQGCSDGANPNGSPINVNGTLYGTTVLGGAHDGGTVFSIDPSTGAEAVLHSFGRGNDGDQPAARVINANGTLYGTTLGGGSNGAGTVFSINLSTGTETVLYSFCVQPNCTDGDVPYAPVIDLGGTFYGTARQGGFYGNGVLFELTP